MEFESRRHFLARVGEGMLVGTVGVSTALDWGLAPRMWAQTGDTPLTFGAFEPLVDWMQETPPEQLVRGAVERLAEGETLSRLIGAAALANARRFGGHDYVGFHTFMALAPALAMSSQSPANVAALPVLKVLYRNADRIQRDGGPTPERLASLSRAGSRGDATSAVVDGTVLRDHLRNARLQEAEQTLAVLMSGTVGEAFNHLAYSIQDEVDVHRTVLPWRAWSLLPIVGKEHALTLLRQSVRFCWDSERDRIDRGSEPSGIREVLPRLLDQYRLTGREPGSKSMDDTWLESMSSLVFQSSPEVAADAVAAALAEGVSPEAVGEALSVAASLLVLHDGGRKEAEPGKPIGSVHGASTGVHASDSANAWRNIARVSNARNTFASLIAGAYHTAGQADRVEAHPYPHDEHVRTIETSAPEALLTLANDGIQTGNQAQACAAIWQYGALGLPSKPVFQMLLRYATSEDGALHAEKYYQTVFEEFQTVRPSFRWRHLAALARVTASEFGTPAPGIALARELLS